MNKKNETYLPLAGRILLSFIFIMSGFFKIMDWSNIAGYMASKEMPFVPLFLAMAIIIELVGGISILIGYKVRIGALLLIVFLIPTTFIFHNFWAFKDMEQMTQMVMFMKNLSIMGGLLLIVSFGAGSRSIDCNEERAKFVKKFQSWTSGSGDI